MQGQEGTSGASTNRGRFIVESVTERRNNASQSFFNQKRGVSQQSTSSRENDPHGLYLYEHDIEAMKRVPSYVGNALRASESHRTTPGGIRDDFSPHLVQKAKLGTFLGVYLPTIQHILGLLMFVRHAWIVGSAGLISSLLMALMCCASTLFTSISLSAIATNGIVPGGGSYSLLSRNLGAECGGAIGVCLYLANTFATCLYLFGAIEILLRYIVPEIAYFGDMNINPWNNYRVYGTVSVVLLFVTVAIGMKFVSLLAPISLACVILSTVSIVTGCLMSDCTDNHLLVCVLGDRLLSSPELQSNTTNNTVDTWCNKNITGDIWSRYCIDLNSTVACDDYFTSHDAQIVSAFQCVSSSSLRDNLYSAYMSEGDVTPGVRGNPQSREVASDTTTSFVVLCAIYFPSVTGILTGANLSGELGDPQKSIPFGTIAAQLTCSFIYVLLIFVFGIRINGAVLRDKFGQSIQGQLLSAAVSWPSPYFVLIGAFISSVGAALQCIVSAARLLQAMAKDDIIPPFSIFKPSSFNGEPLRALGLTIVIAELGICIANLDTVAPIIDIFVVECGAFSFPLQGRVKTAEFISNLSSADIVLDTFFLMCYFFINVTCCLQTLLQTPSWRPSFYYYHWSLSLLGVLLTFTLAIIAGWYYALAAFVLAGFVYKYIEYKGGTKEWGGGIRGLKMLAAQRALLALDANKSTGAWLPQILVLCKLDNEKTSVEHVQLLSIASQLKAGKGLTIVGTVVGGSIVDQSAYVNTAHETLAEAMKSENVKGFVKVFVADDVAQGLDALVQTVGIGALEHNTVLIGWPTNWRHVTHRMNFKAFIETVKVVNAKKLAVLIARYVTNFPTVSGSSQSLTGTIDIWWIVHDGGLLVLLGYLLHNHPTWSRCQLRIFTVAQLSDNSLKIKKDLETFLYKIRIKAEVFIEEMYDNAISAYTVEKTMNMENRIKLLNAFQNHRQPLVYESGGKSYASSAAATASTMRLLSQSGESTTPASTATEVSSDRQHSSTQSNPAVAESTENGKTHSSASVHFTFTAKRNLAALPSSVELDSDTETTPIFRHKLMRMHTAVQLNDVIRTRSGQAQVVIINLPTPPPNPAAEQNYMEYLDVLTEGLQRVIMVHGCGREVVTMYA